MKKYMRAMTDGFGIRLPMCATNDQNDPELNDINIWFREQYQAFHKAMKKVEESPELTDAFQTYQNNVFNECVKAAQKYLDRVYAIHDMPWQNRPAVNFQYDPKCFEEQA